jgi:hypothetical protein
MNTGLRAWKCELSSVDTALLMLGVIYAENYFDRDLSTEREIRQLAEKLTDAVDWKWMLDGGETLSMGWHPESGFLKARWRGYNEASFLYLLGLGAKEANRLPDSAWRAWTSTYEWKTNHGLAFIPFGPLFGHQYTGCWIDLRYIQDEFMRARGSTYFDNSRRATLAQRDYCIANPGGFAGYGTNVWGLTACDGPTGYMARSPEPEGHDDGTVAPTAAGGSLVFTPDLSVAALREMYDRFRSRILCPYGFRDAFNLRKDWWDRDALGDQGPILLMAENLRSSAVWEVMKNSLILRRGLQRAGFRPAGERIESAREPEVPLAESATR